MEEAEKEQKTQYRIDLRNSFKLHISRKNNYRSQKPERQGIIEEKPEED